MFKLTRSGLQARRHKTAVYFTILAVPGVPVALYLLYVMAWEFMAAMEDIFHRSWEVNPFGTAFMGIGCVWIIFSLLLIPGYILEVRNSSHPTSVSGRDFFWRLSFILNGIFLILGCMGLIAAGYENSWDYDWRGVATGLLIIIFPLIGALLSFFCLPWFLEDD